MKRIAHSSRLVPGWGKILGTVAFMTLSLGGLVGCDEAYTPRLFNDNEIPAAVMQAPHAVGNDSAHGTMGEAMGEVKVWPKVGAVPSKPKDFYPDAAQATVRDLQAERNEAARIRSALDYPIQ